MAKNKIPTGQAAENAFVTRMGGEFYRKGAGSQATDIIMSHPEHGDFETEMKGGPTVDHSQMRVAVDNVTGKLKQTVHSQQMSGDRTSGFFHPVTGKVRNVLGLLNRPFRGVELKPGQVTIERQSKKDPSVTKVEKRAAAMDQVKQAPVNRIKMNNQNAVSMMSMGDDHIHVAVHHKTGEVAFIPTKDKHRHLGDKMGLDKTVTYNDLAGDDHGHKNTLGLALRGARPKAGTLNASLETSSGNMVDAVRDAGGHVFKSLDHATEHLRGLGWTARSGHAMSESVGMLLQGKYHEAVALNEVVTTLLEAQPIFNRIGNLAALELLGVDLFGGKIADDKPYKPKPPIGDLRQQSDVETGEIISTPFDRSNVGKSLEDLYGEDGIVAKSIAKSVTKRTIPTKSGPPTHKGQVVGIKETGPDGKTYRWTGETWVLDQEKNESVFHVASVLHEDDEYDRSTKEKREYGPYGSKRGSIQYDRSTKEKRQQGPFGTHDAEVSSEYKRRVAARAAGELPDQVAKQQEIQQRIANRKEGYEQRRLARKEEYEQRRRARNESVFHIASVLHEDDKNYSDDEISRDKDPNAAGGPYSEDDIKVTQDPRDAAPGMDPVADPPTQQAKQVTTGMVSMAPAAAGTMQTMLPGGEHDAIQKQYPDLIEGLCGSNSDMKGGFLTDPKDKKKAAAAFALMASLDKKLKDDKKARVSKILNNNKPPAIPGSEGY